MAEVSAAGTALHFGAAHAVAAIFFGVDVFGLDWLIKARPSGARFELGVRVEQLIPARHALVHALFFRHGVFSGEWPLRSFFPTDVKLFGSQFLFPFFIRLNHFVFHTVILALNVV